jgi:hypothetical protein
MRAGILAILAILTLAGTSCAAPIRLLPGRNSSDIERYAVQELRGYLARLTDEKVAQEPGDGTAIVIGARASNPTLAEFTPSLPETLGEQEIVVASGSYAGQPAVAITGGSPAAVLWATYAFLEKLGVVFEFSGEILPPKRQALDLSGIGIRQTPSIKERGLRLHLNFPMDQSSYSLPDFFAWVDRIARMKCNYLMLHFYSAHPWFFFQYKDAKTVTGAFFVGSYLFNGRYDLPTDMIGRSLIANKAQYFPPELEGTAPGEALYHRTEERIRAVIDHAHRRGIKVAVSFEPLAPPGDIAAHLGEWEQAAGGRDALMHDLTVARLNACMDAYPNADEFQMISVEGSDDAPAGLDLKADLRRLCDKYKIPFDPNDERQFAGAREAGVNLAPYNAPAVAADLDHGLMRPVVATLRYVDLALGVFADPRVSDRMKREGKQANVGIYLPNAAAVKMCTPALREMIPANGRLQMMVDYGARGTADQMPTWEAFRDAKLQLGVISWLEFDGSMFLPESWPRSVYDCVHNAKGLPLTTLVCNHWRVSGLEADAATLADVPWSAGESYDAWMQRYLGRTFGPANAAQARKAYDALEKATLYCRARLFNIGFCFEGRFRGDFGYPPEDLDGARKLFSEAGDEFAKLAGALAEGRSKQRAAYLANRCACAVLHIDTVHELGGADVRPGDPLDRVKQASAHAEKALEYARGYMQTYSKFVLDRGDQGMLVNYEFAVVKEAEAMAAGAKQVAVITGADPRKPIMAWDFEKGDAVRVPDVTGNGFDADCVGTVAYAPGRAGRALKLDGKSYLQVNGATAFNPQSFTICAWINPEKTNVRRGIVVKRIGNSAAPFVFGISDGALRFEGLGTGGTFWPFNFSGPAIAAGKWSHVAVTFEGSKRIVLYVNGAVAATKDITESPTSNNEPICIGREAWGGEDGQGSPAYFRGMIEDVRIWKRALNPDEVAREAQ